MNVVKQANEQDGIKMAFIKIRPCSNARIHAELTSSSDRLTVAVDCNHSIPVLRQVRCQFACSATNLENASAFRRKEPFDEIVSVMCFESHFGN